MTKKEMIKFLKEHPRYSTDSGCGSGHSFAHNVKIRNLGFPKAVEDIAYELLETTEPFYAVDVVFEAFAERHNWCFQISQKGRSGGYYVLVAGGRNERLWCRADLKPGEKGYSDRVGRWFDYAEAKRNGWIGKKYYVPYVNASSYGCPAEIDGMGMPELKAMVKIVKDFDATVKKAIGIFRTFAEKYKVVEETIMVPRQVKRCVKNKEKR